MTIHQMFLGTTEYATSEQQVYTMAGTYSWTAPSGTTSISVVCVGGGGAGDDGNAADGGGGGGGGGALAYANNIPVTSGQTYTVVVGGGGTNGNGKNTRSQDGGSSTFTVGSFVMTAAGGQGGAAYNASPGATGGSQSFVNIPGGVTTGGGAGGGGGAGYDGGGGGGGAGGYTGVGGNGGASFSSFGLYTSGFNGVGAGSGGGGGTYTTAGTGNGGGNGGAGQNNITGGGGGGALIYSTENPPTNGGNGNNLTTTGSQGGAGGFPGGGGGGSYDNGTGLASAGGSGAVRIIWPGTSRQFPSTNVADTTSYVGTTLYNTATPGSTFNTYTFNSVDLGSSGTTKAIVVVYDGAGVATTISSATIGGVAATVRQTLYSGSWGQVAILTATGVSATTGNIVLNFGANLNSYGSGYFATISASVYSTSLVNFDTTQVSQTGTNPSVTANGNNRSNSLTIAGLYSSNSSATPGLVINYNPDMITNYSQSVLYSASTVDQHSSYSGVRSSSFTISAGTASWQALTCITLY